MTAIRSADDVRGWLAANPSPSPVELAEAGLVAPHYPRPWGLGAGPDLQLAVEAALDAAGVELPDNPIGVGWAGPTLVAGGTDEQLSLIHI